MRSGGSSTGLPAVFARSAAASQKSSEPASWLDNMDCQVCRSGMPRAPVANDTAATRASSDARRSEEHTSELQSLMRIFFAVYCLKKTKYIHKIKCHHKNNQ